VSFLCNFLNRISVDSESTLEIYHTIVPCDVEINCFAISHAILLYLIPFIFSITVRIFWIVISTTAVLTRPLVLQHDTPALQKELTASSRQPTKCGPSLWTGQEASNPSLWELTSHLYLFVVYLTTLSILRIIKSGSRRFSTHISCSEGPYFTSRPRDRLCWLKFFVVSSFSHVKFLHRFHILSGYLFINIYIVWRPMLLATWLVNHKYNKNNSGRLDDNRPRSSQLNIPVLPPPPQHFRPHCKRASEFIIHEI
jgi:hypothetical protein